MSETRPVGKGYEFDRISFLGIELLVAPGALVPHLETELLGRTAIEVLRGMSVDRPRVVDMCCGAGNLACAIASHVATCVVWAADVSATCAELAARNVGLHGLEDRVSVHQGDLFAPLENFGLESGIDAVVCNPPYISETRFERERARLLKLGPREAFAAGPYGLSMHLRVIRQAVAFLRPGGVLLLEVGLDQDRQVETLIQRTGAYEDIQVVRNEAQEGRVVSARKRIDLPQE